MQVYKAQDLMVILKIGRDKAYSLMRSDSFPSYKVNGHYFITEDALNKWLLSVDGKEITI